MFLEPVFLPVSDGMASPAGQVAESLMLPSGYAQEHCDALNGRPYGRAAVTSWLVRPAWRAAKGRVADVRNLGVSHTVAT